MVTFELNLSQQKIPDSLCLSDEGSYLLLISTHFGQVRTKLVDILF